MDRREVYTDPRWAPLRERILARDKGCLFAWLLGGACDDRLDVHHIEPIEERPDLAFEESNLATACSHHHPMLEALRRAILGYRRRERRRCPHAHRTRFGREACERSLNTV